MKKFKDIVLIIFVYSLFLFLLSCGKKTTEPSIVSLSEMTYISGGAFTMGDTKDQGHSDERPTHRITVSPFYIDKYLVTRKEYDTLTGSQSYSDTSVEKNPAPTNWYCAIRFCNLRSIKEGLTPVYIINDSTDPADWGDFPPPGWDYSAWDIAICNWDANGYRLPTEAEWEYAARGGVDDPDYLYSGSDNLADVAKIPSHNPYPVGTRAANGLGIYDMSGCVYELCWDWYDEDYYQNSPSRNPKGPASGPGRVIRGGSWRSSESRCRVAYRTHTGINQASRTVGFRVCRSAN